jgi:threonine dehydrogenase-like Zn-dependent dehydrogenase
MEPDTTGRRMGHEFIGVVDAIGADVRTVKRGDLVVGPFAYSKVMIEL